MSEPRAKFVPAARELFKACATAEYEENEWIAAIAGFAETAHALGKRDTEPIMLQSGAMKLNVLLPEGLEWRETPIGLHGFYEDPRSPTGLTFYCRAEDWRFIVRVHDFFVFCPACGKDHRSETMSTHGLWMVTRGNAP